MAFSLTHTDNSVSTADATTYTFTSQTFGDVAGAGETRFLPVARAVLMDDNGDATTLTVGGVSGDSVAGTGRSESRVDIYTAAVPTGTTGTVEITVAVAGFGCGIDVFRLIQDDPSPATYANIHHDDSIQVATLSLNVPTGGGAIGLVLSEDAGTTTWSGLTEVSDIDIRNTGGDDRMSGALGTTAGTPLTITATNSDATPGSYIGCAVSWEPTAAAAAYRMFLVF